MWEGKCSNKFYKVQFDPLTKQATCSCLLFEFRGIVCRHALLVFGQEDVYSVPVKYVLRRWSKNVRRRHTLIRASYSNSNQQPSMQRYQLLCKQFYDIAEVACESELSSEQLRKDLDLLGHKFGCSSSIKNNVISDGGELRYEKPNSPPIQDSGGARDDVLVRSPLQVKRKGRPRTNRLKSTLEKKTSQRRRISKKTTTTTCVNESVSISMLDLFHVSEIHCYDICNL